MHDTPHVICCNGLDLEFVFIPERQKEDRPGKDGPGEEDFKKPWTRRKEMHAESVLDILGWLATMSPGRSFLICQL